MWLWFVEQGWLYCVLIMGIVLTVQLIVHWKDWDILRKLGAFTVIVLVFHVWEEWVIPGGFIPHIAVYIINENAVERIIIGVFLYVASVIICERIINSLQIFRIKSFITACLSRLDRQMIIPIIVLQYWGVPVEAEPETTADCSEALSSTNSAMTRGLSRLTTIISRFTSA